MNQMNRSLTLLRRLLGAIGVWLGVALLTFAMTYLIPADPVRMIAGAQADPATIERIRVQMHLGEPVVMRFLHYLLGILHGDFGRSYASGVEVLPAILARVPATLQLALGALVVYLVLGILLGSLAGVEKGFWGKFGDRLGWILTVTGVSLPTFWLGMMLLYGFSYRLSWFPLAGYGTFAHLVLPSLTLGLAGAAAYNRLTRQGLKEAMLQDYIRTARAKGLPEHQVILRHGLRNALLPIVTLLGMDFAALLGGAVLTETVFAWPGVGYQAMQAIFLLDVPMIMGTVLFAATAIVLINLGVDLLYRFLDPRLQG